VIGFTAARAAGCLTVMIPDLLPPPSADWPVLDSLHIGRGSLLHPPERYRDVVGATHASP
jgi:hypothetical protein